MLPVHPWSTSCQNGYENVLVPTMVGMISLDEDGQVLSGLITSPAVIPLLAFDLLTSFQWS